MNVNLHSVTPDAEASIIEVARVSSSRENKREDYERLIKYLIKHSHWSPFEHAYMTVEIETSKAIAIQLLRHRSFTFQEFSQRYQDVRTLGNMFEYVDLRKQADNNRQSSTDSFDPHIEMGDYQGGYLPGAPVPASARIRGLFDDIYEIYVQLLEAGVARETARMILPMATKTKLYMTGSARSWIHFLQIRDDADAQKEVQEVARAIKEIFREEFPVISDALWGKDRAG